MKKGNATLVLLALLAFTAIAWVGVVKGQVEDKAAYKEYMEQAASCEEKEIYIDALENYQNALKLDNNNYDIVMKIADMYYKLGDYSGFISSCDQAIQISSNKAEPYLKKAEYYMSKAQYTDAIDVVNTAKKAVKNNEAISQLAIELSTKCIEKYVSFTSISDWHVQGTTNYVAVEENGKWGMTLKDGTRKIKLTFDYVGAYDEATGVIPCSFNGQYYYIDIKGNKKLIGDNEYQYLGSFGNDLAPAQKNNVYGYINTKFDEKKFEFEYAGAFVNDVAAVKKDGKWALMDSDLKNITGFDYDEILLDSNGFCAEYEVIIARKGDKYLFLNLKGKQIGSSTFDGASIPASKDGLIAVKQGDKWGFVDRDGKVVIEAKYQCAKSFSMGLAPVESNDRWGYINTDAKVVIEQKYFDAGVFSSDGSAPVKNVSAWNFLVLCEYDK